MSDLEIVLAECLFWVKKFNYHCPDVGPGSTLPQFLNHILKDTGVSISEESKEKVLFDVEQRCNKWHIPTYS